MLKELLELNFWFSILVAMMRYAFCNLVSKTFTVFFSGFHYKISRICCLWLFGAILEAIVWVPLLLLQILSNIVCDSISVAVQLLMYLFVVLAAHIHIEISFFFSILCFRPFLSGLSADEALNTLFCQSHSPLKYISVLILFLFPDFPLKDKSFSDVRTPTRRKLTFQYPCPNDVNSHWLVISFSRNYFSLQSSKWIREHSIPRSACENNQSTYQRGTVRTLHYCNTMIYNVTLYRLITTN